MISVLLPRHSPLHLQLIRFLRLCGDVEAYRWDYEGVAECGDGCPYGNQYGVYVVWTGIGAVGTVILGIALFDEPRYVVRLVCIGMIIVVIARLKLSASS